MKRDFSILRGFNNVSDCKSEVIKRSRVKGKPYTNWQSHAVQGVTPGSDCR